MWELMHESFVWKSAKPLYRCKVAVDAKRLVRSTACGSVFKSGEEATKMLTVPEV